MKDKSDEAGSDITARHGLELSPKQLALMEVIEAQPGAVPKPMAPPRAAVPNVLIYKVKEKMFAIMSLRGAEGVILKCDPDQALLLRERYEGIGHRSHLDPRFWISVGLNADVPADEVHHLVRHSYEQVVAKLTRKQKAELTEQSE